MADHELTFGDPAGPHVRFGPLCVPETWREPDGTFAFLEAPVTLVAPGATIHVDDRSGIEAAELPALRIDCAALRAGKLEYRSFTDHDCTAVVHIKRLTDTTYSLKADLHSEDVWDVDLGTVDNADLRTLEDVIEHMAADLGPLTGHCGACGLPSPWSARRVSATRRHLPLRDILRRVLRRR